MNRQDFPIFKNNPKLIYLDNAATSQRPKQVIDAISNFSEKENSNIQRGLYTLAENALEKFNSARETIAKFINASSSEIIFTRNTTESLNLLSHTLKKIILKNSTTAGEILLTQMEHHSNIVPWQQLVKENPELNLKISYVKINEKFELDLDDLKNKLSEKTAIISLTHISNVLGTENQIQEIVQIAKSINPKMITIIDAAQSVAHKKINVKEIDCDFLAFSSHKMLGPTGLGILYGRGGLLEKLPPFNTGGGMIENVSFNSENTTFLNAPEKFEAGTQNISGVIGLAEAINYINSITLKKIHEYEHELTKYALKQLNQIPEIKIFSHQNSSSIISFTLSGTHPHDVASHLNSCNIAIRAGHLCAMPLVKEILKQEALCRISIAFYNTKEEIDNLIIALQNLTQESTNPSFINTNDELIKENIIDHYKNPRNNGILTNPKTISHTEQNALCGDEIQIFLELDETNKRIKEIKFQAKGCAISIASASMLSEIVKNKTLEEIKSLNDKDIKNLLQLNLGIVRTKCATLPLVAINNTLKKK